MYHTFPLTISKTYRAFPRLYLVIQNWPFPLSDSKYSSSVIPAIPAVQETYPPKFCFSTPHSNPIHRFTHTQKQNSWPHLSTLSPAAFSLLNPSLLPDSLSCLLPPLRHLVWGFLPHITFQDQTAVTIASPRASPPSGLPPRCLRTRMVSLTFRSTRTLLISHKLLSSTFKSLLTLVLGVPFQPSCPHLPYLWQ